MEKKAARDEPHFYGGQAVMEGVMMRGKTHYSMAVRKPDGEIKVVTRPLKSPKKNGSVRTEQIDQTAQTAQPKPLLTKIPIIRGIMAFGSAMALGMKTMTESAEIATEGMEEEEQPSKFEQFLMDKLGGQFLIYVSVALAIALAMFLFVMLPLWVGGGIFSLLPYAPTELLGVIEGFARLAIFLLYIWLISRNGDIQRVFAYHGAEHKTINAHENSAALTEESVRGFTRLHRRCGTSFLLVVMVISIIVFAFVRTPDPWLRMASRLVLIPIVAGFSYEVIRWAGRSKSPLVAIISAPGLLLQRLTTREPDALQIETAISALRAVIATEEGTPAEGADKGEVVESPEESAEEGQIGEGEATDDVEASPATV